MRLSRTGLVVSGSLPAGMIAAAALVFGPFAGAEEHAITGAILLALAGGWALIPALSGRCANQSQRWPLELAAFLALAGASLQLFSPGDFALNALGWIWPPAFLAVIVRAFAASRQQLRSRSRWWLVYPTLIVYGLTACGGAYQAICETLGRRLVMGGTHVEVDGRRVFLACIGDGSPTVVLEAGLGGSSGSWKIIAPAVAGHARVCAYDRAGRGGSEPASSPRDGTGVAEDLHRVLSTAGVAGPFVLVAHSSGAQYIRIFAGRYLDDVAGMVMLDAQPAEALTRLPDYPSFYWIFRRVSALLPSLARVGVSRLVSEDDELASARHYRSLRDEVVELPVALAQAAAVRSIGDRPLMVITAAQEAQPGWLPLQAELARLSTNSYQHVLPDATHASLMEDPHYAEIASRAIRDVVEAVRSGSRVR